MPVPVCVCVCVYLGLSFGNSVILPLFFQAPVPLFFTVQPIPVPVYTTGILAPPNPGCPPEFPLL